MPRTATDNDVQQEEEEEDEDAALGKTDFSVGVVLWESKVNIPLFKTCAP